MDIIIQSLLLIIFVEALLALPFVWKRRVPILIFTTGVHLATSVYLLFVAESMWMSLAILVLAFRIINNVRILANRKHPKYLWLTGTHSIYILGIVQLLFIFFHQEFAGTSIILVMENLAFLQLGGAMLLLAWTTNSIFQMAYHEEQDHLTDKELPTVTVAIPARNETLEIAACLDSIISSNYPKLEILVLDDCSQDKTPEIIKQYAHAGIRFIQGGPAKNGWLAKNHAYAQLADEASGALILFCGVDVRMSPDFLRKLVTYSKNRKKRMVSVLPIRLGGNVLSGFIQPMRYWWEMSLPRKYFNRPAVLSTCWMIDTKVLKSLGGFDAVKQNILPERYFARECVAHDRYSFIRANEVLDLRTAKQPSRQISTTVRMRYPQLKNQPEGVLAMIAAVYFFTFLPFTFLGIALYFQLETLQLLSIATISLLLIAHVSILRVSNPSNSVIGLINFPIVILTDMFLTLYSMLKYEFGEVRWKGRNVCLPVAHTSNKRN